jgi:maltose O-acetyltransferase
MNIKLLKEKVKRIVLHREFMSDKELRLRGMTLGEGCVICTNKLDLGHAFLIQIGNNTTLSDCRILAHDASTKKALGYSKVGG